MSNKNNKKEEVKRITRNMKIKYIDEYENENENDNIEDISNRRNKYREENRRNEELNREEYRINKELNREDGINEELNRENGRNEELNRENDRRNEEINRMDYYKILGVKNDATQQEIKNRYRHLLTKYHPDKMKKVSEEVDNMNNKFKSIRKAGEILIDENKRKFYDIERKTLNNINYNNQKIKYNEYIKLQERGKEGRRRAEIEFKQEEDKMNEKYKFNLKEIKNKINKNNTEHRIEDLRAQREMEYIECIKPNLFEGKSFSNDIFNKKFEKYKEKKGIKYNGEYISNNDGGDMSLYDNISSYYDTTVGDYLKYNNYSDNNNDDNNSDNKEKLVYSSDISSISSESSKSSNETLYIKKNYEDIIKERNEENTTFQNIEMNNNRLQNEYRDKYEDNYRDNYRDNYEISKNIPTRRKQELRKKKGVN